MKYYANDREDRFVHRYFDLPKHGIFVDVGAFDGITGSNTYFFEKELDWTGVCIDGDPRVAELLKKNRAFAYNNVVSNYGGEVVAYYVGAEPEVSGLVENSKNEGKVKYVKPVRLSAILERERITKIDLLSVDTEGSELDVLMSFDLKKHDPEIIIVENITHGVVQWDAVIYLRANGYLTEVQMGANQIMRKKEGSKVI